jgi:hypothetical protein
MADEETIIDTLYNDFTALIAYLDAHDEPSFRSMAEEHFKKSLLLATASYFENRIGEHITSFAATKTKGNALLSEFIKNKALARQFHTFFDWKESNANQFFGFFGKSFVKYMRLETLADEQLSNAIKSFMEIGRERNRMVHEDFGSFSMVKTLDEVYSLYKIALLFVDCLPEKLAKCPDE